MRFCRCLRGELYRVFHTPTFLLVLLLLSALALVDGILAYREYRQNLENALTTIPMGENGAFQELPFLQTTTLYNSWIGGHPNSVAGLIFIYACPVYASLAYSWTYLSEEQNGYARILVAKVGKRPYYFCKHFAVFFAGALSALLPMLVSLLLVACLIPAYRPSVEMALYYQVGSASLLRDLYFSHPLAATLCNVGEITLFAGLWATVPLAVSYFVKNRFIALFAPYLVLLFLVASAGWALVYRSFLETSIFNYLQLTGTSLTQSPWMLLGQMGALLILPLAATWGKGSFADVL